ncbi:hypothetical protein [Cellulomonas sp. NPDC058312]|uniref:DUF7302 family protein n=1 Tax=Cellulomonas sp. NPDC058312 TaxID=3346441 RepID=UPI0036F0226E
MRRLKNRTSGVLVSVDDELAAKLGDEWEPLEEPKPRRAPRKKAEPAQPDDE